MADLGSIGTGSRTARSPDVTQPAGGVTGITAARYVVIEILQQLTTITPPTVTVDIDDMFVVPRRPKVFATRPA